MRGTINRALGRSCKHVQGQVLRDIGVTVCMIMLGSSLVVLQRCFAMSFPNGSKEPPTLEGFDDIFPPSIQNWYCMKDDRPNHACARRIDVPEVLKRSDVVQNGSSYNTLGFPYSFTMEDKAKFWRSRLRVRVRIGSHTTWTYWLEPGMILIHPFPNYSPCPGPRLQFVFGKRIGHGRPVWKSPIYGLVRNIFWGLNTNRTSLFTSKEISSNLSPLEIKEVMKMESQEVVHSKWLLLDDEDGPDDQAVFTMMYVKEGNKLRRAFLFHVRPKSIVTQEESVNGHMFIKDEYMDKWVYIYPDSPPKLVEQGKLLQALRTSKPSKIMRKRNRGCN